MLLIYNVLNMTTMYSHCIIKLQFCSITIISEKSSTDSMYLSPVNYSSFTESMGVNYTFDLICPYKIKLQVVRWGDQDG